ncbi:hypothetical protein Gohar_007386, partial [Gossypium harknessii]|nr:hypothetical protein [Gossypium harknessii]
TGLYHPVSSTPVTISSSFLVFLSISWKPQSGILRAKEETSDFRPSQLQFAPHRVKIIQVLAVDPVMTADGSNPLISVQPNALKFVCKFHLISVFTPMHACNAYIHDSIPRLCDQLVHGIGDDCSFDKFMELDYEDSIELEKPSFCDLKVVNNTEHFVAFKVKTTSPKKYFVRPNTGVVQPWDSSVIRVTLQAPREYPPDMQCKDKFLLQSTIVPPNTDVDDLPADTFNKESTKEIQECKLKVFYVTPSSRGNSEDEGFKSYSDQAPDSNSVSLVIVLLKFTRPLHMRIEAVQQLKDERDAAVRQTLQLQQE